MTYGSAGRVAESVSLLEQAAADSERVLGRGDRITLVNHAGLGHAHHKSGRISESISLLQQVLAEREYEAAMAAGYEAAERTTRPPTASV
jgi:Tetratricopeptide repeat